jgi:hypothetical protein
VIREARQGAGVVVAPERRIDKGDEREQRELVVRALRLLMEKSP